MVNRQQIPKYLKHLKLTRLSGDTYAINIYRFVKFNNFLKYSHLHALNFYTPSIGGVIQNLFNSFRQSFFRG